MPALTPPCTQQHVETCLTFLLDSKSPVSVSHRLVCAAHVSCPLARGKQAAKALVEAGADPKLYSLKGMTPLIHAVDEGPACEGNILPRERLSSLCLLLLLPALLFAKHLSMPSVAVQMPQPPSYPSYSPSYSSPGH